MADSCNMCFGTGQPVYVPDPRRPDRAYGDYVYMTYVNPDCPVHGTKVRKSEKGNIHSDSRGAHSVS